MTDYKLGTVADATVDGRGTFRVMRVATEHGPMWAHSTADDVVQNLSPDSKVTNIRPLVAVNPAAPVTRRFLNTHKDRHPTQTGYGESYGAGLALADLIRQEFVQRIPEPRKYGVVIAGHKALSSRYEWVSDGKIWRNLDTGTAANWEDLTDPVLAREGVLA